MELLFPQSRPTKWLASLTASRKNRTDIISYNENALLFCYDLAVCPDTFDFIEYMTQAEIYRRKKKLTHIDLLIVQSSSKSIIPELDYLTNYIPEHQRVFKVHEVIFGSCRLMPTIRNILFMDRMNAIRQVVDYKNTYPENYHPYNVVRQGFRPPESPEAFFPMLVVPETAKRLVGEYLQRFQPKKIVTITLREHNYIPERNSNIEQWLRFADSVSDEYQIIFIPDAYNYSSPYREKIKEFEVLDTACWNIPIRAAIYEASWMNLGVVAGPLMVSLYLEKANTLFFYNIYSYPESYRKDIQNYYGDKEGEKRPYLRFNNHYVFMEDDFDNISSEFKKLNQKLVNNLSG